MEVRRPRGGKTWPRRLPRRGPLACALSLLLAAGCEATAPDEKTAPVDEPSNTPTAAYTLFDPDLDDAEPVETARYGDWISTTYEWAEYEGFTLSQQPDPGRDLCEALAHRRMAGDTCTVEDGVMVTRMEEFSGVALVRDDTLLFASSLLTEGNDGLLDRSTEALRSAPAATLADLGDLDEVSQADNVPAEAPPRPISADDFDVAEAMGAVRHLAGDIGPREATGAAYDRAARWVGRRFARLGYDVGRQRIAVPAGSSWGVAVPSGESVNVIATPSAFRPDEPHLIVGAHLDTVPQAPGAEDNASGIGVILAAAKAASLHRTRLPVVFIAFGAEEPRSETDPEQHHFGSREYVRSLRPRQRANVRGMISLDRVGVGARVPVGSANESDPVQRQLLAAAGRAGVPTTPDPGQRSSDHWSFVRVGLPGARLGSTPYVGYHSAQDVVSVVQPAQLERVGRLVLAWIAAR